MLTTRRRVLLGIGTGAASLLATACGVASPPAGAPAPAATAKAPAAAAPPPTQTTAPPVTSAAPTSAPAATPVPRDVSEVKKGGTLRAAIVGDLTGIDGQQSLPGITATVGNGYEPLTRYDEKLQPQPILAESWEVSTDGKQIKLNIRRGVQFHDGRELTSEDVKYSLMRLRDPKLAGIVGPIAAQSAWWTTVEAPDKFTLVLGSEVARPGVFDFFQYMNIVDQHLMEGPDAKTRVNGTGPFKFGEWLPGAHVKMERNPNYWRPSVPNLDAIETRIFRDPQAMVASLEGGALDLADSPGLLDLVRLKEDSKYQALSVAASGQFVCIVANTTVTPTNNKQFRQAINYAINRQRFVDTVFRGIITDSQDLPFPPHVPAYDAARNKVYAYDLDKARAAFTASGVTDTSLELVYSNTSFGDTNQSLAQILQADLKSIGINLTLRPVEFAAQFDLGNRRAYQGLLLSVGSGAQIAEASSLLTRSRFFSPDAKTSFTGLDNAQYAQLVAASATEPDLGKRRTLYSQIQDIILDESASMTVSLYPQAALATARVRGLAYDFRPALTYASAWLA